MNVIYAMQDWMQKEGRMVIKSYMIAFIAFMSSLCFADVAKLKTITVVTNLVYDTGIARRNSCVVAPNYAKNRFVYWNTSDTNTALWAAVLYSRYELAEHYIPVERRTVFTISDFAAMQSVDYFINHVCVTNMDAEVFTFAVENPGIRNPGRFALVKFTEGGLFLYAVYVNLATGKTDLDFYEISEANLLLAREVTFPYLTKQECRYQRHIIKDVKGPSWQDRKTETKNQKHGDYDASESNSLVIQKKSDWQGEKSSYLQKQKRDLPSIKSKCYKEVEVEINL